MKYVISLIVLVLIFSLSAIAQKPAKPWTEWDKKEIEKMLNSSPWGQSQADTDTSNMMFQSSTNNSGSAVGTTGAGASRQAMTTNYRVRFFSARPIREAFARQVLLSNPNLKPTQLDSFLNGDYSDMIVVSVTWDGADKRYTAILDNAFGTATTETIKKKVYLERKDGKQIEITDYARPSTDGTGAKFVFPRMLDGKPFVEAGDGTLRFYADMGSGPVINWRFKLSDMNYNGKFEL